MKLRNTVAACSIFLALNQPVQAVTNVDMCLGASDMAVMTSRMQFYNLKLMELGNPSRYTKEKEVAKLDNINEEYRPIYANAVEYGFDNPSLYPRHVHEMVYSQCMHWMRMNNK